MPDGECVFCRIVSGLLPAKIVGDSAASCAFMDAFPLAAGHVVVVPRRHCERIQDMTPDECADLFGLVQNIIKKVDALTGATLMAVHNGRQSGQEIPHVHVHMIPRSAKDGAGPVHSMFEKSSISEQDTHAAYEAIRKN